MLLSCPAPWLEPLTHYDERRQPRSTDSPRFFRRRTGALVAGPNLSPNLHARRYLKPYDPTRTERFDLLVAALRSSSPHAHNGRSSNDLLPFYQAYFSNDIEGTKFTLDEAVGIVYDDRIPQGRSEDAHDIIGTFRIVNGPDEMSRIPANPQEFIDLLRAPSR